MTHDHFARIGFASRTSGAGAGAGWLAPLVWLSGAAATIAAVTIGAVLAIFTAAAVAVIAVCASMLMFLASLAVRARRRVGAKARPADVGEGVIEARRVGDTWVAYGWDGPGR